MKELQRERTKISISRRLSKLHSSSLFVSRLSLSSSSTPLTTNYSSCKGFSIVVLFFFSSPTQEFVFIFSRDISLSLSICAQMNRAIGLRKSMGECVRVWACMRSHRRCMFRGVFVLFLFLFQPAALELSSPYDLFDFQVFGLAHKFMNPTQFEKDVQLLRQQYASPSTCLPSFNPSILDLSPSLFDPQSTYIPSILNL